MDVGTKTCDSLRTTPSMSVVIPVRNAIRFADRQIRGIINQTCAPQQVIIIDSESSDGSPGAYRAAGFNVTTIAASAFNHGETRNMGWRMCDTEIVIYLTHDAIPTYSNCFERVCAQFSDPAVGIVCGRQLARDEAKAIERHARLFNYPASSNRRIWPSAQEAGFKAIFNSNSFAAYRRSTLQSIGGFAEMHFGEDQVAAARALLNGWTIAYAADAIVEHSHDYSPLAEFLRYIDIGIFHYQQRVLLSSFRSPHRDGRLLVASELRYLLQHAPRSIPESLLRSTLKLLGYQFGRRRAMFANMREASFRRAASPSLERLRLTANKGGSKRA
jgi:rhamnosyltransferase